MAAENRESHAAKPPPSTKARSRDTEDDTLLRRRESAELIEVSVPTLGRLEKTVLPPALIDTKGVHWHSLRRLNEYKATKLVRQAEALAEVTGELAAAAFDLFDARANAADVVKALRVTPHVARELRQEWADLRGGFVVGGEATIELQRPLEDSEECGPIRNGDDLVRIVEQVLDNECAACSRRLRFCLYCFFNQRKSAVAAAQTMIAQEEAEAIRRQQRKAASEAVRQARVAAAQRVSATEPATSDETSSTDSTSDSSAPPRHDDIGPDASRVDPVPES
jgi:hypothetical protein